MEELLFRILIVFVTVEMSIGNLPNVPGSFLFLFCVCDWLESKGVDVQSNLCLKNDS